MTGRAVFILVWLLLSAVSARADTAFDRWLQSVWPDAQALGVSRPTFDAAVRGLEPDYSLPDLAIPGKPEKQPQQPEFVQTPTQYLRESAFQAFTSRGKELAAQYRDTLARIEREIGVRGNILLAIWARESGFSREFRG